MYFGDERDGGRDGGKIGINKNYVEKRKSYNSCLFL